MNTDIRLSLGCRDHPKIVRLIKILGDGAFACLVTLWLYTAAYFPKGILVGLDPLDIEIRARWPGENELFVETLHELRLLDCAACPEKALWASHEISMPVGIHDWEDHQPWAYHADARSEIAREKARKRWTMERAKKDSVKDAEEDQEKVKCKQHEKGMQPAVITDAAGNAGAPKSDAPVLASPVLASPEDQDRLEPSFGANAPGGVACLPSAEGNGERPLQVLRNEIGEMVRLYAEMKGWKEEGAFLSILANAGMAFRYRLENLSNIANREDLEALHRVATLVTAATDAEKAPEGEPVKAGSGLPKGEGGNSGGDQVQAFFDLWNAEAASLPKAERLTETRKRKIQARLRERPLDQWGEVFRRMNTSRFLRRETGGTFKANLDWITKNETNSAKVLEGIYDDTKGGDPRGRRDAGNHGPGESQGAGSLREKYRRFEDPPGS